jgi:hypothetical protein
VFKKALQVATAFGVLLAGYAGYVHVFALVADRLARARPSFTIKSVTADSKSLRQAMALAVEAFGAGHWTADKDLGYRYYNDERGFWMYAREYERKDEGKTLVFTPFALIWKDKNGKGLKTALSESATIYLDQPLGLGGKPDDGAMRVTHARIERDVRLRDDKGTPDPSDDLRITGPTFIAYDEKTLTIVSDDNDTVIIDDRDMRIVGEGLQIDLRPNEPAAPGQPAPTGFNGAKTAVLRRKVHVVVSDVGSNGILPGSAQPRQQQGGKTPVDLRCDGKMQVDLPEPRKPVEVGPPAPSRPTLAHFYRNVEVLRGKPGEAPDRLNCDELLLTLVPAPKPPAPDPSADPAPADVLATAPTAGAPLADNGELKLADVDAVGAGAGLAGAPTGAAPEPAPGGGPLNDLTLYKAHATGHNVRIVSAAQGVKARGRELIHTKLMPERPDETYFRGSETTRLIVEKTDVATQGPNKGQVTGFTTIRAKDATIFDNGQGNDAATIVARGPGEMESRAGPNKRVERTADWSDELKIYNVPGPPVQGPEFAPGVRKRIALTGRPSFSDAGSKSKIQSDNKLIVWLKPKADPAAGKVQAKDKANDAKAADGSGAYDIEILAAYPNVHLTAPARTLVARDKLDAVFVPVPDPKAAADAPRTAPATAVASAAPADAGAGNANAPTEGNVPANAPEKPTPPEARAVADRVWARVLLLPEAAPSGTDSGSTAGPALAAAPGPGQFGNRRSEIDEARLRGAVEFHQDPEPGKARGTDVVGAAVDLVNRKNGATRFLVYHRDPAAEAARPKAPVQVRPTSHNVPAPGPGAGADANADAGAAPRAAGLDALAPLARVETEDLTIFGEVIGLDQSKDYAWVEGRGSLTQMTARGLFSDKGQPNPPTAAGTGGDAKAGAAPVKKTPLTIYWASGMTFQGFSTDPQGRPAGRAEFYDDVRAEMEDSLLTCRDIMRVYLDRTMKLNRPAPAPERTSASAGGARPAAAADEPKADIALVECVKDVVLVDVKYDPAGSGEVLEKKRLEGDYMIYRKADGRFRVPVADGGLGKVFLYQREGQKDGLNASGARGGAGAGAGAGTAAGNGRVIRPTAGPARPKAAGRNANQGQGQGQNRAQRPQQGVAQRPRQADRERDPDRPALPPLVLTQIKFTRDMYGRFGTGKETDKTEVRWADFFGDVEVLRGRVADADSTLDPDRPPAGAQAITSQVLRVVSEPNLDPARPDAPARDLLRAWGDAYARVDDKTVQADTITYDSVSDLFYAYGENGHEVLITQQDFIGQPASTVPGRTVRYNHKTGESEVVDPQSMALINFRAGQRPKPEFPPDPNVKPMRPTRQKFKNPMGGFERKGFSGR